ncbi:MAG: hypothetical protein CMJ83_22810 [Planctomycetes bacterium]|nr:hypothetical protein [Planctomycetota bacterium]
MSLPPAFTDDRGCFEEDAPPSGYVALQRIVVRMLFDPAFVDRVYADPRRALEGLELDPSLVEQLVANDRRLWNADRLRRTRALNVLMEELKVSSALALLREERVAALDLFFSSDAFHAAVQRRRYLALAFVEFLAELFGRHGAAGAHGSAVLALEGAMAWCRREVREARRGRDADTARLAGAADGRYFARVPGRRAVSVPGGTILLVQHIERWLFEASLLPALSVCADAPRPDPLPPIDPEHNELWLLESAADGKVDISALDPAWHAVAAQCERPSTRADVEARILRDGGDPKRTWDRAEALLDAGILRRLRVHDGVVTPC